jgi:hypothetical protein
MAVDKGGRIIYVLAVCMPNHSRIQLLPDKKFWTSYLRLCAALENPTEKQRKEIYDELNRLDKVLRPALDARWAKTDAYYKVADDWNVCWHHSMGVYSDEMCCRELLDIVQRSLGRMKHDWCFHVALECDKDMGWGLQRSGRGQIFFYRGDVFGNKKNKFDYAIFDRSHL